MRTHRTDRFLARARPRLLAVPGLAVLVLAMSAAAGPRPGVAQEAEDPVRELILALRELRDEVKELRRELGDLRREVEELRRTGGAGPGGATQPGTPSAAGAAAPGEAPREGAEPARPIPLPATVPPYFVDAPVDGAVLRGRIVFRGTAGEPRLIPVTRDAEPFGPTVPAEDLLVAGNGGVENAIAWLDGVARGKPFAYPAPALDARGPRFVPRVQVAVPHAVLRIFNSNSVGHVFRAPSLFNLSVPSQAEISRPLPGPGLVRVSDDLHPWIESYVFVAPNPYAVVTGTDGGFEIAQIPPGKHRLRIWHETLGETTREIEAKAGGLIELEVPLTLGQ